MPEKYKTKHVAILDHGLFAAEIGRVLAPHFGKTSVYTAWEDGFPSLYQMKIGEGYKGITRCNDFYAIKNEVDLWIFPDILFAGLQTDLEESGKRVWGARYGEEIENLKIDFREHCKEIGVPVSPYKVVTGMTEARKYLETHEDKWLKVELIRGNFETFHVENLKLAEPRLQKVAHDLGPWKEKQRIIIEDSFPDSVEVAFDLWSIDGLFPGLVIFGIEIKGKGYFCFIMKYEDLPWQIRDLNEKFVPTLKEYHYRSNFPVEIRINKKGEYVALDPCTREGHPVFSTKLAMIKNLPDVFWNGAEGKCIDPKFDVGVKCGMELVIFSDWAATEPQPVYVPPKYRDAVKFRYAAEVDGVVWVLPQPLPNTTLGSITATGKSWQECKDKILEIKDEIKGEGIDCYVDAMDEVKAEWEKLRTDFNIDLPKL